jgi:hypothetical protein
MARQRWCAMKAARGRQSAGLAAVLLCVLTGCGPTLEQELAAFDQKSRINMERFDAERKVKDAAFAAKGRCEFLNDQSQACLEREVQRHSADPVGAQSADSKERQRRSDALLAEWVQCHFQRARELAPGALPATEVATQAVAQCDAQRAAWVKAQGSGIRSAAESVASSVETTNYPTLLAFVERLRGQ